MRKNILLALTLFTTSLVCIENKAQTTINFDDATKWTAGSGGLGSYQTDHTYIDGAFSSTGGQAFRDVNTNIQDGFPAADGTYSWRLRDVASAQPASKDLRFTIASGGVSTFSVSVRRWDASPSPNVNIEYSTDGGTLWNLVANVNNTTLNNSSDWTVFNGTINSTNSNIIVRFFSDNLTNNPAGSERIIIDNFVWNDFAGPLNGSVTLPNTSFCVNTPLDFTVNPIGGLAPYSYEWNFGIGNTVTTTNTTTSFTYPSDGNYNGSVTITDANSDVFVVNFNTLIYANPTSQFSLSTVLCFNEVEIIDNSIGTNLTYDYVTTPIMTQVLFDNTTGNATYSGGSGSFSITQTISDINGCSSTSTESSSFTLPQDASFSLIQSICQGETVSLTANNTFGSWSGVDVTDNGDGTGLFTPGTLSGPIDITYSIIGICGSFSTETIFVYDTPDADFTFTGTNEITFTNTSQNMVFPSAIIWNFGDGNQETTFIDPTHEYLANGTYTVCMEVVNGSGCTDEICKTVTVIGVGVKENSSNTSFTIYPNPSNGLITVNYPTSSTIIITNVIGKEVYRNNINGNSSLDLSHLPVGTYLVTLKTNESSTTKKIIIK